LAFASYLVFQPLPKPPKSYPDESVLSARHNVRDYEIELGIFVTEPLRWLILGLYLRLGQGRYSIYYDGLGCSY